MRDISAKVNTLRTATASATLEIGPKAQELIKENSVPKGNPFEVAKVAAVQAAKSTSQLIPYCHPLPIDFVGVEYNVGDRDIEISVTVKAIYKTGVEMEALTAASVAALTFYDMLKMFDEEMSIKEIRLLEKTGGKSEFTQRLKKPIRAAVLVMSDTIAAGKKNDLSGQLIRERLASEGAAVEDYKIVPDDQSVIEDALKHYADEMMLDLVVTTGGTGLSPRDNTPEAMQNVLDREIPGIAEAARNYGQLRTPYSMLSRGKAGVRKKTLIINLPGSKNGVRESLDALFPAVLHSFKILHGGGHHSEQREKVVSEP